LAGLVVRGSKPGPLRYQTKADTLDCRQDIRTEQAVERKGGEQQAMPIPDFQSLMLPVLRFVSDGKDHSTAEMRERIAGDLKLTPDELAEKLKSGNTGVFAIRKAKRMESVTDKISKTDDNSKQILIALRQLEAMGFELHGNG
jgi:hypothetical protein